MPHGLRRICRAPNSIPFLMRGISRSWTGRVHQPQPRMVTQRRTRPALIARRCSHNWPSKFLPSSPKPSRPKNRRYEEIGLSLGLAACGARRRGLGLAWLGLAWLGLAWLGLDACTLSFEQQHV